MNNLMYLRDACSESMSLAMPSRLRALTLSWLNIQCPHSICSTDRIRLLHPLNLNDSVITATFPGNITYYSTIFINQVRFTTAEYACGKRSDDSNIIFKTGANESFGRIRHIFKVNDSEPLFYVTTVPHLIPFECATSSDTYRYFNIGTSSFDENESNVLVNVTDIIEKCVLYERLTGGVTFYRFPNLQESS